MALAHIVTRGYGNGTLSGDVNLIVTRGYIDKVAIVVGAFDGLSRTGGVKGEGGRSGVTGQGGRSGVGGSGGRGGIGNR